MNKLVVWLIYLSFWWKKKHEKVRDDVLRRAARLYWFRVDWLIKFGLFATFAFFALLALLASGETCGIFACENRFGAFLKAPANEVGDTLAGIAGGLAFLWLVVTVLLQGKELAAQREELRLTRSELTGQREAAQDMARSMAAQASIFEEEQRTRDESKAQAELEEILKLLASRIRRYLQPGIIIPSQYLYTFWFWTGDWEREDVLKENEVELAKRYQHLRSLPDKKYFELQ